MRKVKILKATACQGARVNVGDVVEESKDSRYLVAIGKGEYITEEPKKPGRKKKAPVDKSISTDELETR